MNRRAAMLFPASLVASALVLQGCGLRSPTLSAPATRSASVATSPPAASTPSVSHPVAPSTAPAEATPNASNVPASTLPLAGISVGQTAPDFALTNLGGQTVRLSDFRGQPVVVNFFATWCGPCKDELPRFQAAYQQHRDQGFQVILVDLKEAPSDVGAFATKLGLTMPIVVDDRGTVAAGQYRLTGLPTTVFVDANGVVRGVHAGPLTAAALTDNVAALLSGATTPSAPSASQSGDCCALP